MNQCWVIGLTVAGLSAVAGPRGYLPQAGPPPLRYRSAAAPPEPAVLPPLPAEVPPVAPSEPTTGDPKQLDATPESTTQEQTLPEPPAAPVSAEMPAEPEAESRVIPSTPSPALSPQLLIPFFTSDAESAPKKAAITPTVVAPVSFVPPPPSQKSVSQATYSRGK